MTPRETATMVVLHDVRITADSVIGWVDGAPDRSGLLRGERTRLAVHTNDVLVFEPAVPYAGGVLLNALLGAGVVALYLMSEGGV